jgi:PAS domain S-box-containing protein
MQRHTRSRTRTPRAARAGTAPPDALLAAAIASDLSAADVLERLAEGVYVLDRAWRVEYINARGRALIAGGRDIVGCNLWEAFPEAVDSPFWSSYRAAMEHQAPVSFEAFYAPLDAWYEVHAFPSPERLVVFFREITRRKAAEEELRTGEERLRLAQAATGVITWDRDLATGATTRLGEWRALYGVGPEEAFGFEDFVARVHPEDRTAFLERARRAVEEGAPYDARFRIVLPDGAVRWLASRAVVLRDADGTPRRLIGTNADITGPTETQEARERRERRLLLLAEISAALLAATDPDRVLEPLFPLIAEEFGLAAMFSYVVAEDGAGLRLVSHAGVPAERMTPWLRLDFGAGVCGTVARDRAPFYVPDVQRSEDPRAAIVRSLGVRAYACEPLVVGTRLLGTLSFASGRDDRFAAADLAFFGTVASYVSVVRDRLRAETELKHLNETLESRVAAAAAERQKAELALAQAQKMETLGQLTGGIAHDFNNLLTIIQGNLELLGDRLAGEPRLARLVGAMRQAADRGERLTGQLLAFARRQRLQPERTALGPLIEGFAPLLRRAVGETVEVQLRLAEGLAPVCIDPAQFENALLNLAVNARDAMPAGGALVVETRRADADPRLAELIAPAAAEGWAAVEVRDVGTGMRPEVVARAFEPFFTTKDVGRGSGLGLSQVYGFVRQSEGQVAIESVAGAGTRVCLYLPQAGPAARPPAPVPAPEPAAPGRGETVLVVEDDAEVRALAVAMLRDLGYAVATASSGPEALALLADRGAGAVDLLFTDIVMPGGMSGVELGRAAEALHPGLKVLLTTGYAAEVLTHGAAAPRFPLVQKPYKRADLARRLRAALARD